MVAHSPIEPIKPTDAIEPIDESAELLNLLKLPDRREPAVADIAVWVALGIIQGGLNPGQDLNSAVLAARFGTSRTPVRDALALLESEEVVEMRARRRPRVAAFSAQRIREAFFVRAQLLAALTKVAAERVSESDLMHLRSMVGTLRSYAANNDDNSYRWAHLHFSNALVDISGNATAKTILNSLFLRTLSVRRAISQPERLSESLSFAERILEAMERRDGELAALLMLRANEATLEAIERNAFPPVDGRLPPQRRSSRM